MRSQQCSALVAVALIAGIGCGGDAKAGAWEFKVDTANQTSWLRLVGQEGPAGETPKRAVILSFDCIPKQAINTIMTDQALRQGTAEARLTLDAKPPVQLAAFAGTTPTGGQVVLTISQDSLLALLSTGQRAVIDYADGAGSSKTTATFPLAGLETYRDAFRAACAKR